MSWVLCADLSVAREASRGWGDSLTLPRRSFHSRRPRERASLVSTPPGEGNNIFLATESFPGRRTSTGRDAMIPRRETSHGDNDETDLDQV